MLKGIGRAWYSYSTCTRPGHYEVCTWPGVIITESNVLEVLHELHGWPCTVTRYSYTWPGVKITESTTQLIYESKPSHNGYLILIIMIHIESSLTIVFRIENKPAAGSRAWRVLNMRFIQPRLAKLSLFMDVSDIAVLTATTHTR